MVRKKESILVILSQLHLLSFRDGRSEFSQNDEKILTEFSKIIKQDSNFKYIVPLAEINCFLLRNLIAEILYVSVEPDGGNIYFITDKAGEAFLRCMLFDLHTESTDLNTNLLKHQKNKIHIVTSSRIPSANENDVAIFFRRVDHYNDIFKIKRAICIITLRDFYRNHNSEMDLIQSFECHGWSHLPSITEHIDQLSPNNSDPLEIIIEEIQSKGISDFYQSANQAGFCEGPLKEYIQSFSFFYMAAPIPLKLYDYYKPDDPNEKEFNSSMLPSQSALRIPGIGVQKSIVLQALCSSLEEELREENVKYKKIISSIKKNTETNAPVAILLPNKIVADAFSWSLFEGKMARGIMPEDITILYPESFFIESLFEEKRYDQIVIPFVPSSELFLATQNLTKKLRFILYPIEEKILRTIISKVNMQQSKMWYNPTSGDQFIFINEISEKSRVGLKTIQNLETNKEFAYTRFLAYLAKGDPKEGDSHSHYEGELDKRSFTFISTDNVEYNLHGWENVILCNENESTFFRKYVWVAPSAIDKNDKIFIIPRSVRYEFFEKELSENLKENITNLQDIIGHIAKWKSALISIKKNNSYAQIQRKLVDANLTRDYVTIRHWFTGLLDDPTESALSSIIDSKSNIGPKHADDIKKVGEAFGIKDLIRDFEVIHYSMKAIRSNNQHLGKSTMNKILSSIVDPEFQKQCAFFKVKKILVK